jgi:CFEM domain
MQCLYVILATSFASLAVAQNLNILESLLPTCSYSCLYAAGQSSGCPDPTNVSCFCGPKKDAIIKIAVPCIAKGCSTVDSICKHSPGEALNILKAHGTLATQKVASQICLAEAPLMSSFDSSLPSRTMAAIASSVLSAARASAFASSLAALPSASTPPSSTSSISFASPILIANSASETATPSAAAQNSNLGLRLEAVRAVRGAALLVVLAL